MLSLTGAAGNSANFSIEDHFPEDFYVKHVRNLYVKPLASAEVGEINLRPRGFLFAQLPPATMESNAPRFVADWQRSRDLWRRVATTSPLNPACERALARANRQLAGAKQMTNDVEAALGFLVEAIANHEAAGIDAATPRDEIEQYIDCRLEAAKLDEQSDRAASARQHIAALLATITKVAETKPSEPWLVSHVNRIRRRFGEFN